MKRLSALFGRIIPQTRSVRDDGSFILSTEDIHRRRMVFVAFFATALTAFYVGWQITHMIAGQPALLNFGFGATACLFSGFALRHSLWGLSPEPYIRVLLLASFSDTVIFSPSRSTVLLLVDAGDGIIA